MPIPDRTRTRRAPGSRAQEILDFSADLFEEYGYSRTTMQDIAESAGLLPGSLYHHFASKEAIAVALLEAFDLELTAVAQRAQDDAALARDTVARVRHLRELARNVTDVNLRHAAAVRLRAYDAPVVAGQALQRAIRADAPIVVRAWSQALSAVIPQSDDRYSDRELLRFAFQGVTLAAGLAYPHQMDAQVIADQLCDLFLHGMLVNAPTAAELDASRPTRRTEQAIAGWRRSGTADRDDKARILAAARTEFARHGYEASTIRGIADTAGITMGTLYRRADSKDAILREILDRYSTYLDDAVRSLLTDVLSVAESLDALSRLFVHASRRFAEEAAIVKLGWNAHVHGESPFYDYHVQTQERLRLLEQALAAGLHEGSVRRIGTPSEVAPLFRQIMWLPYQDHVRSSERRAHAFIRQNVLAGSLRRP